MGGTRDGNIQLPPHLMSNSPTHDLLQTCIRGTMSVAHTMELAYLTEMAT